MFCRICHWFGIMLVILFAADVIRDYIVYTTTLNSAPFYIWVAVDAVCFLLPAGICFAVGKLLEKRVSGGDA